MAVQARNIEKEQEMLFSLNSIIEAISFTENLDVCHNAIQIFSSDPIYQVNENKLIILSSQLLVNSAVEDVFYGIKISAVKLKRRVQIYQWFESESKKENLDTNSADLVYSYEKTWKDRLINSSLFHHSENHENPRVVSILPQIQTSDDVQIGPFKLSNNAKSLFKSFTSFAGDAQPEFNRNEGNYQAKFNGNKRNSQAEFNGNKGNSQVKFNGNRKNLYQLHTSYLSMMNFNANQRMNLEENIDLKSRHKFNFSNVKLHNGMYYLSDDIFDPQIGDVRVQFYYAGCNEQMVTILGRQTSGFIYPYVTMHGQEVLIMMNGERSLEELLAVKHDLRSAWFMRCYCFFSIFLALRLSYSAIFKNLKFKRIRKSEYDRSWVCVQLSLFTCFFISAFIWFKYKLWVCILLFSVSFFIGCKAVISMDLDFYWYKKKMVSFF